MKIFLDAGHNYSAYNTGATGSGLKEQDVTWEIAKKCGEILAKNGLEIKLSRPNLTDNLGIDNSTSLAVRCKMANDWGADLYLSLHRNAAPFVAYGIETFIHKDAGGFSKKVAAAVQSRLVAVAAQSDRGVKTDDQTYRGSLAVLRDTKMPAILVELGFIDNELDNELFDIYLDDYAAAIAEGILEARG